MRRNLFALSWIMTPGVAGPHRPPSRAQVSVQLRVSGKAEEVPVPARGSSLLFGSAGRWRGGGLSRGQAVRCRASSSCPSRPRGRRSRAETPGLPHRLSINAHLLIQQAARGAREGGRGDIGCGGSGGTRASRRQDSCHGDAATLHFSPILHQTRPRRGDPLRQGFCCCWDCCCCCCCCESVCGPDRPLISVAAGSFALAATCCAVYCCA